MSLLLCTALAVSLCGSPDAAQAKKKTVKLNKKKVSLYEGKTVKLKVQGTKKKVKWSSNKKKIATVSSKGKVTAKKKGTAHITAKIGKKKLVCTVTVKKMPPVIGLKEKGDAMFGKTGTCVTYAQLQNPTTLAHVKKHYSSITLENEMKPDAILRSYQKKLIKTDEARANTVDYVIPDNYKEAEIPSLNFTVLDGALKIAKENGLKMRGHTLVWHSQTPDWFFRVGYDQSKKYVSQDVMDARMEMYIRSVMNHVYTVDNGAYKDVMYSWDVVNEYLNSFPSGFWASVYGGRSALKTKPSYVKKAYEIAYDVLKKLSLDTSVSLVYNDYNTYINRDDVISLVNYINEGEPEKICTCIGMQSHLDVDYPSVSSYVQALGAFAGAGYEVQITEFDATINNESGAFKEEKQGAGDQSKYIGNLMKAIVAFQKKTKAIKGFTLWGLCDEVSWRGGANSAGNSHPLLFDKSINDPKESYFAFVNALK